MRQKQHGEQPISSGRKGKNNSGRGGGGGGATHSLRNKVASQENITLETMRI